MLNNSTKFRDELFEAEVVTPALRDAYRSDLDAMLHDTLTPQKRVPGAVLLALLLFGALGEVWTMIVHSGDTHFYIAATTMLVAFASAAAWVGRDLWRGKSVRKSSYKFADLFYGAAGVLTMVELMHGMFAPGDPKSMFGAFFMFVFLFVCSGWSLINRISASELSLREELLRIECRLADLAERLPAVE